MFFHDAPEQLEQSVTARFDSQTFRLQTSKRAQGIWLASAAVPWPAAMAAMIKAIVTVLTDTSLLSIVSDFYNPTLVRILTLKTTWLHANAVLVQRHRSAASLQLLGFEGDWSEVVQWAAMLEMEIRGTWASSTQVGSSPAMSRVPVASQGQSEGPISPK